MDIPFFGEPTTDPLALDAVLARAVAVRIVPRGFLVYEGDPEQPGTGPAGLRTVRTRDEVLAEVRDVAAVQELRAALMVTRLTGFECMCTGDLALEFLDSAGEYLTAVRVDHPDRISWTQWDGDAEVRDPDALQGWLDRNIEPGATPRPRPRRKKPRWSDERRGR